MQTAGELLEAFTTLPEKEQEKAAGVISVGIGPPPPAYVGPIWGIVVVTFAVVLVGGLWILYSLVQDAKSTEVIVPIVTAAVGVLAGLLAPSPVAGG
jgi:hypothetical protein